MQLNMKRILIGLVALMAAVSLEAQVRPVNNHTVSTTLGAGLEYAFEWAFAGPATLVGRIGYASKGMSLVNNLESFSWSATMAPAVSLEPRFYFLMDWRDAHGKYTRGNSAEFIGIPVMYALSGELVVSPRVGVRRAFEKHWFHEFTAGADLMCLPVYAATPHVGYRIGFLF